MTKKISLLGATGSIGTQTLDILKLHQDHFVLEAISIGKNLTLGLEIIHTFLPKIVSVIDKDSCDYLRANVPSQVKVVYGEEGILEVAAENDADVLVNAVMGSVGLKPTLKAIEAGKTIAIANKETLVTAGHIVMSEAKKYDVSILPVDSEHSAIFQCLQGQDKKRLERIILTASGGSFRDKTRKELIGVTVEDALKHPNWTMGAKITIDSATMMNKGLEVIEAHHLFDMPYEKIDVVLHKESIVHSLVEFEDTSMIAQLGSPDMRVPIQYALTYPERLALPISKRLNLMEIGMLHFAPVSFERYRCLQFAYEAGKIGGTMTTVLNAANEEAVQLFLLKRIQFLEIEDLIEKALENHSPISNPDLETIIDVDRQTRSFIRSLV
ncbi:1-deoxy-D-xylulose-5-phosphate reductoisomerase [Calidifontibacillus erzurumensis]|uniref:1-deoxy-D-xylulose 5-phosphate reductoisomerase n=1 Tax=Calidifontibacillus erzurumensis TaxID=2741433 RepID=A0A8J8GC01_9BACI|nr:1-deoxy-D-xylulose-5-phosphate reductoisomerase [Calidifontibacillus erzurumensis]NSL51150.1 1-deoxy-D-xylulose-5-phosphate reductoisomerase [Calidifontibacillus erzurumensis]